jgi:chromosome partitioning protein
MARIIAIANRKGGSGKTATAVNLSAFLANMGYRCLLVDLDPQAHASISVGVSPYQLKQTLFELLLNTAATAEATIRKTPFQQLELLPASMRLETLERNLGERENAESLLAHKLEPVRRRYDFILLDCPAMSGMLLRNALGSAQELLIPLQAHFLAMEGLAQIVRLVYEINSTCNPALRIVGVVPTLSNFRTRLAQSVFDEVRKNFGHRFLYPSIRQDIRMAEAPSHGQPILHYAPRSNAASDYHRLALHLLKGGRK